MSFPKSNRSHSDPQFPIHFSSARKREKMAGIIHKIGETLHIGGQKEGEKQHKEGEHKGEHHGDMHKSEHYEGEKHKSEGEKHKSEHHGDEHKEGGFMSKIHGGGDHHDHEEKGEKKKKKEKKKKHEDGHERHGHDSSDSDSDYVGLTLRRAANKRPIEIGVVGGREIKSCFEYLVVL
ncbi:unnamed protein product [Camellia sinensis]